MRYAHVAQLVFSRPWMIVPETLDTIVELLTFRMDGGRLSADEIEARLEAAGPRHRAQAQPGQGVALISLYGVIAPKAQMLADTSSGGTGLDSFMAAFRTAMADAEIGSIVLDIDSPGGQVGGIPEAAAEIRAARDQKPITSVVNNGIGASAAYYLGSQASEFVASPSSEVGSIGVRMAHEDRSGMYEQKGVRTTLIAAGKYKNEGNPYGPLSEEALAYAQSQVGALMAMFERDVAKGRRVPLSTVKSDFGEGRMLLAADALKAGMIDRIDTLDGVLRRELSRPRTAAKVALGPGWEADAEEAAEPPAAEEAATEPAPKTEPALRQHMSTPKPGGHGMPASEVADMPMAQMQSRHQSMHKGSGSGHSHTGMSAEHDHSVEFELELHRHRIAARG